MKFEKYLRNWLKDNSPNSKIKMVFYLGTLGAILVGVAGFLNLPFALFLITLVQTLFVCVVLFKLNRLTTVLVRLSTVARESSRTNIGISSDINRLETHLNRQLDALKKRATINPQKAQSAHERSADCYSGVDKSIDVVKEYVSFILDAIAMAKPNSNYSGPQLATILRTVNLVEPERVVFVGVDPEVVVRPDQEVVALDNFPEYVGSLNGSGALIVLNNESLGKISKMVQNEQENLSILVVNTSDGSFDIPDNFTVVHCLPIGYNSVLLYPRMKVEQ